MAPRIWPLPREERDEQQRELLGDGTGLVGNIAGGGTASNIFSTLVRHTGLFRKWLPFGGKLLAGKIPPRDRELMILRTAWNTQSEYEWGQHVPIARATGVSDEEIGRVPSGAGGAGWSDHDAALLRAADELHHDSCLTDATWKQLAATYDEKQLIEVPMLVGHYHLVAYTLNTLGVQREDGVVGLPPTVAP
jgi:alkylhydroperoxidase family enzyme